MLFYIYSFFEDDFDFEEIIEEIQLPFRFSKELANCFEKEKNGQKESNKKKDFAAFLVFSEILLLSKSIDDIYFQSMNFNLITILNLYDYIFLYSNSEKELQIIVAKIIAVLFIHIVQFQENNILVSYLNGFFFSEGNSNFNNFLAPLENDKEKEKNIFAQLDTLIGQIVKQEINSYDEKTKDLTVLKQLKEHS